VVMEGHEDMDMPPNADIKIPDYINFWTDDTLHPAMKSNDVLVLYMREWHCPDCDTYAQYFYAACDQLQDVPGVACGQIDIHEEGEVFEEWHGTEEDMPALFIFKTELQLKYKRKPVQFVVNSRIKDDVPNFVHRMLGESPKPVRTEDEWSSLVDLAQNHSDGLLVGLWKPPGLGQRAAAYTDALFKRVAEMERYNLLFGAVPPELVTEMSTGRVPDGMAKSPLIVTYETSFSPPQMAVHKVQTKQDFKTGLREAMTWLDHEKVKRRGHKYDKVLHNFHTEDLHTPDNCSDSRKVEDKNFVTVHLLGRSAATGTIVIYEDMEFVTGEGNPYDGIQRAVIGMCQAQKRLVVLPTKWREGIPQKMREKWRVGNETTVLMEVTLKSVEDSHKAPGRIEWETDPEKIAEHERKVKEQEREREEAIARGEDPDAECKAKEEEEKKKEKKTKKRKLKAVRGEDGRERFVEVGERESAVGEEEETE